MTLFATLFSRKVEPDGGDGVAITPMPSLKTGVESLPFVATEAAEVPVAMGASGSYDDSQESECNTGDLQNETGSGLQTTISIPVTAELRAQLETNTSVVVPVTVNLPPTPPTPPTLTAYDYFVGIALRHQLENRKGKLTPAVLKELTAEAVRIADAQSDAIFTTNFFDA